MSGIGSVTNDMQTQMTGATTDQRTAQTNANNMLKDINEKWVPKPAPPFNSLEDANNAMNAGTYKPTGFGTSGFNKDTFSTGIGNCARALAQANATVAMLKENISSLEGLAKLLDSGDIEGAVMLLQTSRAKGLEKQLGSRISALQDRNAMIAKLNNDMVKQQGIMAANANDKPEYKNANVEATRLKGVIDQMNSDSQLDMIGIQGLVNKRNEAFDTLTNLLSKFQKTIDGIVGNYR